MNSICFVPAILILPAAFGLYRILYAQPAADVLAALAAGLMAVPLGAELRGVRQSLSLFWGNKFSGGRCDSYESHRPPVSDYLFPDSPLS